MAEPRNLEALLRQHTFFKGMPEAWIDTMAGCASEASFVAGRMLCRQRQPADKFFLIRSGRVAVEVALPDRDPLMIQTVEPGDVLGWSWLFPPYEWNFDARAVTDVDAIAMDGRCLRGKCEADPALGYDLMKRLSAMVIARLQATRLQVMDMFG